MVSRSLVFLTASGGVQVRGEGGLTCSGVKQEEGGTRVAVALQAGLRALEHVTPYSSAPDGLLA